MPYLLGTYAHAPTCIHAHDQESDGSNSIDPVLTTCHSTDCWTPWQWLDQRIVTFGKSWKTMVIVVGTTFRSIMQTLLIIIIIIFMKYNFKAETCYANNSIASQLILHLLHKKDSFVLNWSDVVSVAWFVCHSSHIDQGNQLDDEAPELAPLLNTV